MATAPAAPLQSSVITGEQSIFRGSTYPSIDKPNKPNTSTGIPGSLRESVYSGNGGYRQNLMTPEWSAYITATAEAAYNPIVNIDDDSIDSSKLNLAARGWNQTCIFTPTDTDTVSWSAGTFIASDGTSYAIGSGNTGNMASKTYIYLDIAVSVVAYQSTTNPLNVIGDGKVFIAVCQNNATEATFNVLNSDLNNIDANNIVANTLSVISANLGVITAGSIDAVTITGGTITGTTFKTASGTGERVEIDSTNGIRIYNSSNTLVAQFKGSALTLAGGSITGGTIVGTSIKTDVSPNARLELDSTNGLRVYNSANALVAQLTQTLVSGSYFNSTIAAITDLRTNDINASNAGGPISIDAGTGATFGGSAEIIIDGSAAVGKHQFKADGTTRVTINPSGLTINSGALTITSGNSVITSGNLTLTSGDLTLTAGDIVITSGNVTLTGTGIMTGKQLVVTNTAANSEIYLRSDADRTQQIITQSGGSFHNRIALRLVNGETESGSDAGANCDIVTYTDSGAQIDVPFKINRKSGTNIELNRPILAPYTMAFTTTQTVVLGNMGGDITATEMFTGASYKSIIIRVRNFSLTAVYTFQNAFVAAPLATSSAGITVTPTTTKVTVTTGGLTNGWVKLEGY